MTNTLMETNRLIITEMTMDMAMDVHENSLDEDTRAYVPDEVFETLEDAKQTLAFLISRYGSTDGPFVYADRFFCCALSAWCGTAMVGRGMDSPVDCIDRHHCSNAIQKNERIKEVLFR